MGCLNKSFSLTLCTAIAYTSSWRRERQPQRPDIRREFGVLQSLIIVIKHGEESVIPQNPVVLRLITLKPNKSMVVVRTLHLCLQTANAVHYGNGVIATAQHLRIVHLLSSLLLFAYHLHKFIVTLPEPNINYVSTFF